ncbi:KN motif and ankyrin repeat domain-containing protein 1a [Syngnathus typhle]|uniref:KN motif and ankyrin repeat domain-containing protein 1a n=1 Tax=Syngnathus typhle TaxID=161592 RepID=UPI002A69CFB7|nr:KN motif and ankyrin repeat domain-containing protein 1a [Syngnathus typhle]XP_061135026.1 KN motif and ankyrin repeat domain-containing protein 1a [Syngnathus typhle]XP_061135027.1 KN motif and ankyrin repeat domain-containing protein 1a [Syngnathus typhle]XP_061135029.1 KN motif and ankyrin repeat domain-containing protein 1a [Syngnathus typhle]XP_061135030.1 KN motif and ankyrin repeat domain-containing protein 1a [Syngnathus typhle]XP_061135031.1 KN motif and ankyrin repeat domain-conta
MAQTVHMNGNASAQAQRCPSTSNDKDCVAPYSVETPYGFQLDLDFLKYVDDIERGNTIKKVSVQRKPKGAKPGPPAAAAPPRSSTGTEWTSTDSLSSSNSDDKQSPVFVNPKVQLTLQKATYEAVPQQVFSGVAEAKLVLPPPSPRFTPRHNPHVEKTLMETRLRLEQERLLMEPPPPRRRLASFGGTGSNSSLSSYSGSVVASQISPAAPQPFNGHLHNGEHNLYYPSSVGGSIRHSPLSSGMATPVTNVSPLHLQQIREQMVVALRRLKELEEQVKTIPILQVKIAVLQEEKRQLAAQSKGPGGFRKRSYSVGSADQMENPSPVQKETVLHIVESEAQQQNAQQLEEFRRLAAEVQALEKTTLDNSEFESQAREHNLNQTLHKSVGVVTDENMNNLQQFQRGELPRERENRDVAVATDPRDTRSASVGVTETMLGLSSETEKEMELQQQTIEALKDKIYRLEVQLKETTHQMEMTKLKLELQAAGGSNKKKADKGLMIRPETYNISVEAKVPVHSRGVGDHLISEARTLSVGVSCHPSVCSIGVGPDHGLDVKDAYQQANICEAESLKEFRSVASGNSSVDVHVGPVCASRGTDPDLAEKVDSCVTAAPESTTQGTNTETELVSRSTNTKTPALTDSFTNTAATGTRTVAAGEGLIKDVLLTAKLRSVAVGTESLFGQSCAAKTKEFGVGSVSVHENFLLGLKTRNIACGPSQLPEVVAKATGDTANTQGGAGLDHYIEKVQTLLREQQMLLAENYSELAEAFGQPQSQFGSINSQLVNTLSSINSAMKSASSEDLLAAAACSEGAPKTRVDKGSKMESASHQQLSAAEQKSRMDLQMSTALHGESCSASALKSIMKKKDSRGDSNGAKKNLQFVGVNGGYETTSSDDSSSEDSSSSGSEEEENEIEDKQGDDVLEEKTEEGSSDELETRERYELSEKMLAACNILKVHLGENDVSSKDLRASINTVQHEWFRVSSQKAASASAVSDYLTAFAAVSPDVLRHVVNMADGNGNTALHYSVSHSNFPVVKKLLDADVCNVNQQNKAGYTPIMLAALAAVETPTDMRIVEELFGKGDVNARASQAGQTGLMLAVSHGRMDMVRALLAHGADVNLQDDEGSTALMCASEHGHADIVKLLLAQPGTDATLSDSDESNALSIALDAGHKDIAVLLYAHVNFSKPQSPGTPRLGRKMSPSPTRRGPFD